MAKTFGVSTPTRLQNGDARWDNKQTSFEDALNLLISNGWDREAALQDLLWLNGDNWFIINECCQIC